MTPRLPASTLPTKAPTHLPGGDTIHWGAFVTERGSSSGPHSSSERDRPWVMRTYAGHSTPAESNALYRRNLAKGQTGLSVAFDLPTQTGYDPDSILARGEVGKVGVPISHLGDMRALFEGIPLERMNTSMTIMAGALMVIEVFIRWSG